jgi:DNA-binding GntR family transcriptional regulator
LPLFSFAMIRLTGSDTDWVSDAKEHGAIARAIQSGDKEIAKNVCRAGLELFWKKSIALLAEEERQQGVGA